MSIKTKFICAWLYFLCSTSFSKLTWVQSETDFPLQHLTTEDGLSQNSVYKIFQDEHGFMFFGTQVGVDRYDGTEFRKIGISNNIIIDDGIRHLYEDTLNDKLLIGTRQKLFKGDCKLNLNSFKENSLKKDIFYIAQSKDCTFYFNEEGFYHCTDTLIKYQTNAPFTGVKAIAKDASERFYFGTDRGIFISKKPNETLTLRNIIDSISTIHIGKRNGQEYLFVGNERGEVFMSKTSDDYGYLDIILPKQNSKITSLLMDKDSLLWVGTEDKGVFILKGKEIIDTLKRDFDDPQKLSSDNILSIYQSRDSTIWIGTDGGGINIYRPNRPKIKHITYAESNKKISNNHVWAIMKDEQQRLWLGTKGDGIIIYNEKEKTSKQILSSDKNNEANHVHCFLKKDDEVLLGTRNGLYKMSISGNNKYKPIQFQGEQIRCIVSSNNNIFVGTNAEKGKGLYVLNDKLTIIDSALNIQVNDILVDGDSVWLATQKGLKAYSQTKQNIVYSHKDTLSLTSIMKLDSSYWLGSMYKGLMKFDTTLNVIHYNTDRRDLIYGTLSDSRGGLWMSTNDGLLHYHPQDSLLDIYTKEDGLQSNEFNSGAFHAVGDTMYFGGINGVNRIIANQKKKKFEQVVALEYLTSHTKTSEIQYPGNMKFEEHIDLDNDFRYITAKPLILNYTHPKNSEIRYRINGEEWKNVRYGDNITLTRDELTCYWFWKGKNTLEFQFRTLQSGWSDTHPTTVYVGWFSWLKIFGLFAGFFFISTISFLYRRNRWNATFRNLQESINNISRQNSTDAIGNLIVKDLMKQANADYVIVSIIDFNKRILQVKYAGIDNVTIGQISDKYQEKYNKDNQDKIVIAAIGENPCKVSFGKTETDIHVKFLREVLLKNKLKTKPDRFLLPIIHRAEGGQYIEPHPERSGHIQKKSEPQEVKDIPIGIVEIGKISPQRFSLQNLKNFAGTKTSREFYIDSIAEPYYDVLLDKRIKETYEATIKNNIKEETPVGFLKAFAKDISQLCGADYGNIALRTFNSKHIDILEKEIFYGFERKDLNEEQLHKISENGEGMTNRVFNEGKAYLKGNVNDDQENVVILKDVKSEMAIPIKNEEQTIGVLTLCSKENDFFNVAHIYTFDNIIKQVIEEYLKKKQRYSLSELATQFNVFSDSEVPILKKVGVLLSQHFDSNYVAVWQRVSNQNYNFKLCKESTSIGLYDCYKDSDFLEVSMNRGKLEKHEEKIEKKNNEVEKKRKKEEDEQELSRIYLFCDNYEFPEYLIVKVLIEDDYELLINVFSKNRINLNQNDYSFLEQVIDKTADALQGQKLLNTFKNFSNSLFDEKVENTLQKIADDAVNVLHVDNVVLYPFENGEIVLTKAIIAGLFDKEHVPVDDNQYTFVHFIDENGTKWMGNEEKYIEVLEGMNEHTQNLFKSHSPNAFRQREDIKAVAALKLEYDEDPLGIMFFNYRAEKDFRNPDTKKFVEGFANLANIALRNAYYWENIEKKVSKAEEDYRHYESLNDSLKKQVSSLKLQYDEVYERMTGIVPLALKTSFFLILDGINHDLRNFLIHLKFTTINIKNNYGTLTKANRTSIDKNVKEVEKSIKLISNILNLFDFKSIEKEVFGINELIEDLISFFKNHNEVIIFDTSQFGKDLIDIKCLKVELSMVLFNLINNAVRAIEDNDKKKKGKISFITSMIDETYLIQVIDNGIGIDNNNIDRIFDPGFSTKVDGVGIGLFFAREILQDNFYGTIEAESTVGEGTKFSILIPEYINYIDNA